MTSPRERDDGAVRADMPGGWKGDIKNAFTGKGLNAKEKDAQQMIKRLLTWRKNSQVISQGKLQHYAPVDGVYVYIRYLDSQAVMVLLNKNKQEQVINLQRLESFLHDKKKAVDVLQNRKITLGQTLLLAPKSATILDLQ
jgi:hypothetical protein